MTLDSQSNEQVRDVLGSRLRDLRRARGLTQAELAERAGLSRPTVSTLERGNDVSLDSFLSVLRALDLLDALNVTVPEPAVSPIDELKQRSRGRSSAAVADSNWAWGDEKQGDERRGDEA